MLGGMADFGLKRRHLPFAHERHIRVQGFIQLPGQFLQRGAYGGIALYLCR